MSNSAPIGEPLTGSPTRSHAAHRPTGARVLGHTQGTAAKKAGSNSVFRRAQDAVSVAPRRLLNLEEAAGYVGLSFWSFRELVNAGDVPLIRIPRPRTMRQHRRGARSNVLRRALVDVRDLDELIDRWRENVGDSRGY